MLDPDVRAFAPRVTGPDGSVGHHFAAGTRPPEVRSRTHEARPAPKTDLGTELFTKLAVAIPMANECTYRTGAYAEQPSPRLGGLRE
ncbi:hypothetical protein [Halobellus ruber]|uniref:Uncharacterized protein n=1 Tax=Halobellus ruber TaxID=2761102 RepID=A0A7J9SMT7_9EURY|nr:hypothetical protein [Halobellus ruber]MBB6647902.1 hypothetical protein [Halobellus ruber]